MMNAQDVELFKNLSEWNLDSSNYWDLHNDFDCIEIKLAEGKLSLRFRAIFNS